MTKSREGKGILRTDAEKETEALDLKMEGGATSQRMQVASAS